MKSVQIPYVLPENRIVYVPFDVCRAATTITYTLGDGRIVTAVIAPGLHR